jgi:hypothetical protein
MNERLVTFGSALGALVLFAAVFLQSGGGAPRARDVPRPTTLERRAEGYHAALAWLEAEGIRVVSLRERLGTLGRQDLPPSGNLLVVTLPGVTGFANGELQALDGWLRAGNTLLVAAALADAPEWASGHAGRTPGDLDLLTGLVFEPLPTRERRALGGHPACASEWVVLVPNGEHQYFRDVRQAVAVCDESHSERAPQRWTMRVPYDGFALELAHERASGAGALWTRPLGAGRIIVSAFAGLFTNRALAWADNAELFANIVGANVGPHGAVIFDDLRQGLGAVYDPQRFYHDPRLYETVGILLALWFAWVLGSTRLRATEDRSPAPRESDLLQAAGGLLARVLKTDEAARRLFEHFLAGVRSSRARIGGCPGVNAEDRWSALERHPRVGAMDLERLKRWYADAQAGRRVPLERVQELIARTERLLR